MFRRHGSERSEVQNRVLASWLALVAGFVNSAGFTLVGTFTSHVTGNVGRLAGDAVRGEVGAAALAFTLIAAFFLGALGASMALESDVFGRTPFAYAVALTAEAALLVAFTLVGREVVAPGPRFLDAEAAFLAGAMGIQNSLVTRLSGSVVRTTHLTGVITDLGIEAARWFRFWRSSVADRVHVRLSFGKPARERPNSGRGRVLVLLGIVLGFGVGALVGTIVAVRVGYLAMLVPGACVFVTAIYALQNGTKGAPTR
ncbi:MAG TPA: YoaK family protein [Byssovorax sp.]|jgi:uncharacterized membrane protein YoaK (UPF0700 family)